MSQSPIIWTGASTFASGQTPFGFYDSDANFQADADKVANFCATRLGFPTTDVEMGSGSLYACFEITLFLWKPLTQVHLLINL